MIVLPTKFRHHVCNPMLQKTETILAGQAGGCAKATGSEFT